MPSPRPPLWFVTALRAINRHFSVRWDENRKKWAIMEAVRWSRQEAHLNGAAVFQLSRRPEPALFCANLTHRTLEYVRRNDPRRYKSVQDMVDVLDLDDKHGHKHTAIATR